MKKALSILLAVLILTTQSGWAVSVHWCGKKVAAVSLLKTKSSPCSCSKKVVKINCCKNKVIVLKTADPQQSASKIAVQVQAPHFELEEAGNPCICQEYSIAINKFFDSDHPPPDVPDIPVFLRNHSFII